MPTAALLAEQLACIVQQENALAARRQEIVLEFARAQVEAQIATGTVEPEKLEHSIVAQIGLACGASPSEGRRRMRMARDLHDGHDHLRALFTAGRLSEYKTSTVVAATSHLSHDERAEVDQRLAAHPIETLGVRKIRDLARMIAAEVAPEKFAARCRAARSGRYVSVRPAADGMAYLTAHLPVEHAVAGYAALAKAVNDAAVSPEPVIRSRGEIMADTMVELITGQATARDVNVDVQIVVPLEALIDPDSPLPAEIPGHGPVPVDVIATSQGRKTWRRLITSDGIVIGGDSRQRTFDDNLARFLRARDGNRCSEPYCDAPIRHLDHREMVRGWEDRVRQRPRPVRIPQLRARNRELVRHP